MTRLATIDLGTNTVHLLVAEVTPRARGWRTVLATQRVTRLGEGVSATGALGDLPAARTAAVVVDYVARARAAGAARVAIVATSAVRDAAHGRAFAADPERATGRGRARRHRGHRHHPGRARPRPRRLRSRARAGPHAQPRGDRAPAPAAGGPGPRRTRASAVPGARAGRPDRPRRRHRRGDAGTPSLRAAGRERL